MTIDPPLTRYEILALLEFHARFLTTAATMTPEMHKDEMFPHIQRVEQLYLLLED